MQRFLGHPRMRSVRTVNAHARAHSMINDISILRRQSVMTSLTAIMNKTAARALSEGRHVIHDVRRWPASIPRLKRCSSETVAQRVKYDVKNSPKTRRLLVNCYTSSFDKMVFLLFIRIITKATCNKAIYTK